MWISDSKLEHLRHVAQWPDLSGTKYRLVEPIGEGGMGTVYRAHDEELDREVALKVLRHPEFGSDAARRMLREARIIARLEHPGIVPVHDVGELSDGRVFYVMKLVRGWRLDDLFGEKTGQRPVPQVTGQGRQRAVPQVAGQRAVPRVTGRRPVPQALPARLRLFERICETVAFAHAHGVIHRDLKPANVMVGEFGEVLVLDWGVALEGTKGQRDGGTGTPGMDRGSEGSRDQEIEGSRDQEIEGSRDQERAGSDAHDMGESTRTRRTVEGTVIGTPAYMAPEQARGHIDRIDERADVYALGAILYFLLTGHPPRIGGEPDRDRSDPRPGAAPIEPPRRLDSAVPRSLNAVCLKALQDDPAQRYTSADALRADIGCFLSDQSVAAYPERLWERGARVARKYSWAIVLVAAYLVLRVLVLLIWRR